ncbi:MAG: CHAT domain-containing protein [Chitinophagaceae bacterium]|nr:CHAT domain-containing protein [Chitinophagaceae bacterium]
MSNRFSRYILITFFLLFASMAPLMVAAQDDFQAKYNEVYMQIADKKKAATLAKELYTLVEKKKEWQTYTNYYLLKSIFENLVPDETLAKTCGDKADKLMRATVGLEIPPVTYGSDSANLWYNKLYPGLYETKDPDNAKNALAFLEKYTSYRSLANYTGVAYAFERNGDFDNAKKYYEHSLTFATDERKEYTSYMYYILFLTRSGDYPKAEELIRRVETLSVTADSILRMSYRNEALAAHTLFYFYTGDYESYVVASELQNAQLAKMFATYNLPCSGQEYIRLTNAAVASELLRKYADAEKYWKSRDSSYTAWIKCQKEQYPNMKLYPISMAPAFLIKRGKQKQLTKPLQYYIEETNTYYNSFSKYADISTDYYRATQLAIFGSQEYKTIFKTILDKIRIARDFRESTRPFADFAYFNMRDRQFADAQKYYTEMFELNNGWINDIIFTFGERAFVTYYNAKLKDGYENFHSFVKLAKEKHPALFSSLAEQAYNNLLFTKSISLQGTKRRKEAFLKSSDPATIKLYETWLDKKQQLIRQYFKASEPAGPADAEKTTQQDLKPLQDEVTNLENELAAKARDFKKLLRITPPNWKEVQGKLKEGEAAVEIIRFQWCDKVYYSDTAYYAAYIVTSNTPYPEVVYLPATPADLEDKFYKQYKSSIRLKAEDRDSYNNYWKPIADKLAAMAGGTPLAKVYISPDGIYHLINISTLKNPGSGKYVLDEIQVQSATSTGDIAATAPKGATATAVLLGRPTYKRDDNEEGSGSLYGDDTRGFVNSFRDKNIPDLPGTEAEVLSIQTEMEDNKVKVTTYLKDDATEEKLYQLHNPGILHIATHGFWAGTGNNATEGFRLFNAMANSGLLLSGVVNYYSADKFPNTYDGILTAYEAQNLDLGNTSLVVLSACETSLGFLDAGEGVYGLQRAFRAAGAGSIMTSLWKVDDEATRDFMVIFYQQYFKTKDKSASFIYAQKAIRDKYVYPYYWGAFIMMGQ